MSEITKAPEYIWRSGPKKTDRQWSSIKLHTDDVKYIRADRYTALLEAAVSLHYHLFKIMNNENPFNHELFEDAQLALDKWDRLLDDEEE